MKWRLVPFLFCLTFSGLTLSGCSALEKALKPGEPPPEPLLEKILLERALEYERKGQPHRALQAYEAALSIVVAKKDGLEATLRQEAEKHYRQGLELHKQGKYKEAKREFLIALRLWPDSPEVVDQLKPGQTTRHTRYLVHEVKEGEFLAAIAQKYYNDESKYDIIVRYNNLEDAAKLDAGMELRIPEIEGIRFSPMAIKQAKETPAREKDQRKIADDPSFALDKEIEYDPVDTYQEQGVSLLDQGQYLAALHEFRKVLNTDPSRERVREYMALAHYRHGEVLFEQAEYLEARRHFQEALNLDEQCTSCREYLKQTEEAYKEAHYLKGIKHFEEQRLKEAIEEWQIVSKLDTDYKQVQSYLLRAQKLLDKVQELKEVP